MAKEICISSTPHETRLAILEDDQLAEIYYERENEYTLAGSVYKGRVTRVLPGMQSAFVDIGLERDAFLYVTDFLEMEDQEDTDEVERAASQGDTQRALTGGQSSSGSQRGGRSESRGDSRNDQGQREGRSRRGEGRSAPDTASPTYSQPAPGLQVSSVPSYEEAESEAPAAGEESAGQSAAQQDQSEEQGGRRWRGRRRRRGGRGRDEAGSTATDDQAAGDEQEAESSPLDFEAAATPVSQHSSVEPPVHVAPSHSAAPQTPFLLPGESLSKYGASAPEAPARSKLVLTELPPDTSAPLPDRTITRPSTLVEAELNWDGSGLLPGESIARHGRRDLVADREPSATVDAEPTGIFANHVHEEAAAHESLAADEAWEADLPEAEEFSSIESMGFEDDFDEEVLPLESATEEHAAHIAEGSNEPEAIYEEVVHQAEPEHFEHGAHLGADDSETEELSIEHPITKAPGVKHASEEYASAEESADVDSERESGGRAEDDADASASHNVDPLPPRAFRLKDLFGGRKKEEEPEPAPPVAEKKSTVSVSAYAPGDGVVEEEVIEDEEYEFTPLKAHHGDEHDLEDMEEETLQHQIRSGALGEMLQEAQFDHRIEMDEEETDSEEEDEPTAAATPGRGAAPNGGGRERTGDRSGDRGRGRRGRPGSDGRRGPSRRSAQTSDLPIISDLLKPGQEILVQIAKEPIAKKGARITSHIALPGRFLVFMPTVSHVGVSRKIASDEERQRLKRILVSEKGDASGGFIVRTAADGATEEELRADLRFLINLWADIKQRADSSRPPALIYHDLSLIERILRDQVSDNFSHIWVDSEADYERIVRFLNRFSPELVRRVKLYTKEVPLFEHFGIQDEISKALRSKVWLKSGGSIVINQTEALVAIDINTGKYVGKTARLEDTILKTNLDAIPEIVRQIRLRDLGGIIVIDFIDMDERKNRTRVMAALEEALKQDRAPTKVLQFNDFGLVAITRKRVKQSLERTLSVPCPVCQATGMVKSPATVANEIYIEVRKMRKHFDQSEVLLRVNPETAKVLKSNNARWLTQIEDLAGKTVLVKSDATLHPEQFDIQG